MTLKHEQLQDICDLAARQVQELYPSLQLMFIPHNSGQFHEIIETSEHAVLKHPAGKIAQTILDKNTTRELSSSMGMAIHHQVKWFGLASRENILGLFNINTGEFEGAKDARRGIYHLVWHALDLYDVRTRPEYATKFRSGPMIPKRSPMNMARLNLQADVFSAVMGGLMGEENAMAKLANQRAKDSIAPIYTRRAEDYPFVIALETAKYAYDALLSMKIPREKYMQYARQIAQEVSHTFDEQNIRQWWAFSEPAQDMAWRNFGPETILGCAVYTSEDAFVRATAHLVTDIAGLKPIPSAELGGTYNPFANHEQNQLLHREMIEQAFEEAIKRGMAEESGQPLLLAANAQNENLGEGRILGWCAGALQAAAKAFENAMKSGVSPAQAAALEFAGTREDTSYDSLKKIGEAVVDQKRKGYAVTLSNVAELCDGKGDFGTILGAIQTTMADPAHEKTLKISNDLGLAAKPMGPALAPSSPALKAAPSIQGPAPAGPSLGGGANPALLARQRAMMENLRAEQEKEKSSEDRAG